MLSIRPCMRWREKNKRQSGGSRGGAVSTSLQCLPTHRTSFASAPLCKAWAALKTWCCCDCGAMSRVAFCGSPRHSGHLSMHSGAYIAEPPKR